MKTERNLRLFKWEAFFYGFSPIYALFIVYLARATGSWATAGLIIGLMGFATTALEIPVGIFSDKKSRRLTMLSGYACYSAYTLMMASGGQLGLTWIMFASVAFYGIFRAARSGTREAMLYETLVKLKRENDFPVIYADTMFWERCGLILGYGLAAAMAYLASLQAVMWMEAVSPAGALFVVAAMAEPNAVKRDGGSPLDYLAKSLKKLASDRKLREISYAEIWSEATIVAYTRTCGAYYATLIPEWMVNISRVAMQVCGAVGFKLARYTRRFGYFNMLLTSNITEMLVHGGAFFLNNFMTPFISSAALLTTGLRRTAQASLIQQNLSPQHRTTIHSLISMASGTAILILMWAIGLIADASSIYWAMFAALAARSGLVFIYWRLRRMYGSGK
ncbi:MAG: hypothetical protein LBI17_02630 [Rickettsiales bacterium]|jgi:MFS family permease|nr:hypothetical protein [Rickettsiales bacterium]